MVNYKAIVTITEDSTPEKYLDAMASIDDDGELVVFNPNTSEIIMCTYDWVKVEVVVVKKKEDVDVEGVDVSEVDVG